MNLFLDFATKQRTIHWDRILGQERMSSEKFHDAQGLEGDVFKCIAENVKEKMSEDGWKSKMVCVMLMMRIDDKLAETQTNQNYSSV